MPIGRPAIVEDPTAVLDSSELLARLFRALGDATRLRIVELLIDEPGLHQTEIVRRLGASQGRVSEHLACLAWCGFVEARKEGRCTYYRVANRHVGKLVALAQQFLDANQAEIASCRRLDPTSDDEGANL